MRYLLDTNVLVAAFRSRSGASNAIVHRALRGDLPRVVHQKLSHEYSDVLSRPDILAETGLAWADVELVLAHLVASAHDVEVRLPGVLISRMRPITSFLEIAVAAWPCTIVTHNLKDFVRAELRFPQIALCTPGQLLQSLTH